MMKQEVNEIVPELLSTLAMNPFKTVNSASRDQMLAGHLPQHLVVDGSEERWIQTGLEAKFGKLTFSKSMPANGHVVKVISRYGSNAYGVDRIAFSPETFLIYEREDTKEVDYVSLPRFCSQHPYFGFEYKRNNAAMSKLAIGMPISEGEIFLDSPAINENGGYGPGVNLNVAYMEIPAVAEDGIAICSDVLHLFRYRTYETRSFEFGSNDIPLNINGDETNYKIFPDIGDYVRPDGLLFAKRSRDELLAPIEQSIYDVRDLDNTFDETVYVGGGGRVVDIKVWRQNGINQPATPSEMTKQVMKYLESKEAYCREILDTYHQLQRSPRGLRMTPEFRALVREAISVAGGNTRDPKEVVRVTHRQKAIDEWRVEITVEYVNTPHDGAKFTDFHGGRQFS